MRSERDPEYLLEIGRINADARLSEKEKKSLIELAGFETLEEIGGLGRSNDACHPRPE